MTRCKCERAHTLSKHTYKLAKNWRATAGPVLRLLAHMQTCKQSQGHSASSAQLLDYPGRKGLFPGIMGETNPLLSPPMLSLCVHVTVCHFERFPVSLPVSVSPHLTLPLILCHYLAANASPCLLQAGLLNWKPVRNTVALTVRWSSCVSLGGHFLLALCIVVRRRPKIVT